MFNPKLKVLFLLNSIPKTEVLPAGTLGFVSCKAVCLAKNPIPL